MSETMTDEIAKLRTDNAWLQGQHEQGKRWFEENVRLDRELAKLRAENERLRDTDDGWKSLSEEIATLRAENERLAWQLQKANAESARLARAALTPPSPEAR